jgi:splicing factor 3B subunit 5
MPLILGTIYPMLAYLAIAENESIGRERYNFMQVWKL